MERTILHCDLNNFYASVEQLSHPEYEGLPLAVCGNPEARHGIVLAKNMQAKEAGVQTGEALWISRKKCPNIVFVAPHFEDYVAFSNRVRSIYTEFTDKVESFGLDECWLDVSGSLKYFKMDGKQLADKIRQTVFERTGLTISVGVSFTKVLAKLGSDLKKPNATTVLTRDSYMDVIGNMSPAELLMVGKHTAEKLKKLNICTIRQLAQADRQMMKNHFGVIGDNLVDYASGIEKDFVKPYFSSHVPKSVSNGTTTPRDIVSLSEAKTVVYALCELIAFRLRKYGLLAGGISVYVKYISLDGFSKQKGLPFATANAADLAEAAISLIKENHDFAQPLRAITVGAIRLGDSSTRQLSLFDSEREKEEKLDVSIDKIRDKYGYNAITRGVVLGTDLINNLHEEDGFEPFKR